MRQVLQAGELDRRITIQRKSVARDAYGAEAITWVTLAVLWARRRDLTAREYNAAAEQQSARTVAYDIRYRTDLTTAMRIVEGSRMSSIVGIAEMGRREWLTLTCTDFTGGV